MNITSLLLYISVFSGPLIMLIAYKRWKSYWWWYLMASFLADFLSLYILMPNGYNYKWPSNVFAIAEFVLISLFVRMYLPLHIKKPFLLFIIIVGCSYLAHMLYQNFLEANTFDFIGLALYMFYGIVGFYKILQSQSYERLDKQAYFWLNAMLIVHSATVFTMSLFAPYLYETNRELLSAVWPVVISIANIFQHIMLLIAFTRKDYR